MLSIFTTEFIDDNEENKARVYDESKVGNLVPIEISDGIDSFYIITGLEHKGTSYKIDKKKDDELDNNYDKRIMINAKKNLKDVKNKTKNALVLSNKELKQLLKEPEFIGKEAA